MQRPAILPRRDLRIGFRRLREGQFFRERDDAPQLSIELFDALQIDVREPLRRERLPLNPA